RHRTVWLDRRPTSRSRAAVGLSTTGIVPAPVIEWFENYVESELERTADMAWARRRAAAAPEAAPEAAAINVEDVILASDELPPGVSITSRTTLDAAGIASERSVEERVGTLKGTSAQQQADIVELLVGLEGRTTVVFHERQDGVIDASLYPSAEVATRKL